ncbi:MAG TPA: diacylglycerol kinase family protein [Flavobacterium sp.]|nr:diacylglycerol kinase family protein [Flavobacterium sp.]
MKQKEDSFLLGRLKSFKYALTGLYKLITTEDSIISQLCIGTIVMIAGWYFDISRTEWMFQILALGLVLSIEGLNTAVEKIADFIHPDYHKKIGFIKDISAGAVTFAALTAVVIGLFIYLPKIFNL